jgi:hypothetical protein
MTKAGLLQSIELNIELNIKKFDYFFTGVVCRYAKQVVAFGVYDRY